MAERQPSKLLVVGSSPTYRSMDEQKTEMTKPEPPSPEMLQEIIASRNTGPERVIRDRRKTVFLPESPRSE